MEYKDKVVIVTGGAQAAMTIDTTNLCSHLQKKLFEPEGVYYPIWQAMQNDEELTAVVRSRQLHIYRNGKKILILAGKARVNSISPGWIDTDYKVYEGPDAYQQPAGRVGNPLDIANMVLFLCSEKAGFITGENICIDGGMTRQMIYHGDCGWKLE